MHKNIALYIQRDISVIAVISLRL